MIVVDASCIVEVLLQASRATRIERRWVEAGRLHAPELVDLEILQVLRRLVQNREISTDRADVGVAAFETLALRRWSHRPLLKRIWTLRDSLSAYDAVYVSLAEHLRCPLLTLDRRMAGSHGHRAQVEVA